MSEPPADPPTPALLDDPELLRDLRRFIGGRVPRVEADDVLQTTLAAALESDHAPPEPDEFRRWIFGVARNKVADHFRKRGREPLVYDDAPDQAAPDSASNDARELMRWVEKELPEGDQSEDTLEWMLREGAGEKLENIAKEENLPAPRVRQRVSRLRRYFRTRWAAAAAVLAVSIVIGFWLFSIPPEPTAPVVIAPERDDAKLPRPEELRKQARRACDNQQWRRCLVLYDEAKALDEKGDALPAIQADRKAAHEAIKREAPLPPPTTTKLEPTPTQEDPAEFEAKADDTKSAPQPTKAVPKPVPTERPSPRPAPKTQPPTNTKSKKSKVESSFESEMQQKK